MIDLIPPQFRLLAIAIALLAAAAGGAVLNGWRLEGAHQRALSDKDRQIAALRTAIADQNHAVEALGAAKTAAEERRQVAEKFAASAIARTEGRSAAVAASKAPDCAGVMREAWGGWK